MNTHAIDPSPFHAGEQALQEEVGKRADMEAFGRRVIRDHMPDQHREFYAQLPFLAVGSVDTSGNPWATLLTGKPGFVSSPDAQTLDIQLAPRAGDPVTEQFDAGAPLGLLGIELPTRRRNRMNGRITELSNRHISVRVDQAFGNCPQYIQTRSTQWLAGDFSEPGRERFTQLPQDAASLIAGADTFFVASAVSRDVSQEEDPQTQGVDVSHRGGLPGFVRVDGNTLTIPDFPGNNHFNTLGNFVLNPRAGLLFADFQRGDLLQMTGTVELLPADHPEVVAFTGAERAWRVHVSRGQWLREALPLRFGPAQASPNNALTDTWAKAASRRDAEAERDYWRQYRVTRIEDETHNIRSFYLQPADGSALLPHQAGQHLPIRLSNGRMRTYTLSSAPADDHYRISVKREAQGEISRALHDTVREGDLIEAKGPNGGFYIDPNGSRPVLLIGGGVGITPMIAIARHLAHEALRTRRQRPVTVFHAARESRELAFAQVFARLAASTGKVRYYPVLSRPGQADDTTSAFVGRLDADMLRRSLPLDDYDVYLCGPGGFMQDTYAALRELGIADERIHAEAFGPSALVRDTAAPDVEAADNALIEFADSQVEQFWSDTDGPLLGFAEQHGLEPEFSCRGGSCGTCATRVVSGQAVNLNTGAVAEPGESVLICSAAPAAGTDRLILKL